MLGSILGGGGIFLMEPTSLFSSAYKLVTHQDIGNAY